MDNKISVLPDDFAVRSPLFQEVQLSGDAAPQPCISFSAYTYYGNRAPLERFWHGEFGEPCTGNSIGADAPMKAVSHLSGFRSFLTALAHRKHDNTSDDLLYDHGYGAIYDVAERCVIMIDLVTRPDGFYMVFDAQQDPELVVNRKEKQPKFTGDFRLTEEEVEEIDESVVEQLHDLSGRPNLTTQQKDLIQEVQRYIDSCGYNPIELPNRDV